MKEVVGIRFKKAGKMYYFDPAGLKLEREDGAIVETARGVEYGTVIKENTFVAEAVNRPDILEVVARKAAALLGRPVRIQVVDMSAKPSGNAKMQQLLNFGRAHSDIVNIKE